MLPAVSFSIELNVQLNREMCGSAPVTDITVPELSGWNDMLEITLFIIVKLPPEQEKNGSSRRSVPVCGVLKEESWIVTSER